MRDPNTQISPGIRCSLVHRIWWGIFSSNDPSWPQLPVHLRHLCNGTNEEILMSTVWWKYREDFPNSNREKSILKYCRNFPSIPISLIEFIVLLFFLEFIVFSWLQTIYLKRKIFLKIETFMVYLGTDASQSNWKNNARFVISDSKKSGYISG